MFHFCAILVRLKKWGQVDIQPGLLSDVECRSNESLCLSKVGKVHLRIRLKESAEM